MIDEDAAPIGVTLSTIGVEAGWWLEAALRLDDAGYRAIWSWDHVMGRGEPTVPVLEAWTMLSALAPRLQGAFLGTFVSNVMNRHPAMVARAASTLQAVSRGRFRLGIGIGGHPREHQAYGIPFPEPAVRAEHLREAIGLIRALWRGGPATLAGEHYVLDDAYAFPVPDPPPPILVAGQTPAGVRMAATLGDGWAAETPSFEDLEPAYRAALEGAGRRRAGQLVVVGLGGGRSGRPSVAREWLEDPRRAVARWQTNGADEVAVTARSEADVAALVAAGRRWAEG